MRKPIACFRVAIWACFVASLSLNTSLAQMADMKTTAVLVDSRSQKIKSLAGLAIEKGFAPGVIIMIRDSQGVVFKDIQGFADIEAQRPLREDGLFRIYSMTKPVTSVVAMSLVEEGILALDQPVSRWIPSFADSVVYVGGDSIENMETEPLARPLQLRDLMQHTAGMAYKSEAADPVSQLFVLRGIDTGSGADTAPTDGSPRVANLEQLVERIAAIPLRSQPGETFIYGNAVDVLGRVIEVATGQRLGEVMAERIFIPLEMEDTFFMVPESELDRFMPAYQAVTEARSKGMALDVADISTLPKGKLVVVDKVSDSAFTRPRGIDFGGAGLVSTASDYLKFVQMITNGGEANGQRILAAETVKEMLKGSLGESALDIPNLGQKGLNFGLGFAVIENTEMTGTNLPVGIGFWGGAASTFFWSDPVNGYSGVVMTQVFGGDFRAAYLSMVNAWYEPENYRPTN